MSLTIAIPNAAGAEKILFINGIDTSKTDQNDIQKWVDTLNQDPKYEASYVPTFGPGIDVGILEVHKATPQVVFDKKTNGELEDPDILTPPTPSDLNGLNNPLLNGEHYNTIYAHSGGTRTAVTALLTQNVKTDTLVLVSPVTYTTESKESFNDELRYLLQTGKVGKVIVYQSSSDKLPFGDFYQMKYDPNNPEIKGNFEVKELDKSSLGLGAYVPIVGGMNAHKQMWYTALKDELGSSPPNFFQKAGSTLKKLVKFGSASMVSASPGLIPPSSDMSSAAESNMVSSAPANTAGNPQTGMIGNMNIWYWNVFTQGDWNNLPNQQNPDYPGVPPVPPFFKDGTVNSLGYDWVDLPTINVGNGEYYSENTGISYSQSYRDSVKAYEASHGGFSGVAAGAGPL